MKFKTADDAFSYIESFTNLEKSPNLTAREYRLDRMFTLCRLFGNPQNNYHAIHVAGSKGKGSTAAFTAAVLDANGLKTGLYCSPHVETYKERINLAGNFFADELYAKTASSMISLIEKHIASDAFPGGPPTTFELLTLLAFLIFREAGCDWAVFETGLGGRLDATNVITPQASILTVIELEHTEYLGTTITEVAGEKAGIIKPGVPVFSARQTPDAEDVFRNRADKLSSPVFFQNDLISGIVPSVVEEGFAQAAELSLVSGSNYLLRLRTAGSFQIDNAALAVSCLEYLSKKPDIVLPDNFNPIAGIDKTALPGRMEVIRKDKNGNSIPLILLDGAHTIRSVESASKAFRDILRIDSEKAPEALLLFGAVEGKDINGMAEILCPFFKRVIISTPGSFKRSNPEEVFRTFTRYSDEKTSVELIKSPSDSLNAALQHNLPVLVCGSFYMVAEIRKLLK